MSRPARLRSAVEKIEPAVGPRVAFDGFELDLGTGELTEGGVPVGLRPQPARLLALLVSRAGRLVTREEIREHVWGDTHVSWDQAIHSTVRQIRVALRDTPEEARYIETVPRHGYRFVGATGPVASRNRSRAARRPARATLLAAALAAVAGALGVSWWAVSAGDGADRRMLAVLPFRELGPAAEEEWFRDGLTEELITELARLNPRRLGVIARTSAMRFRDGATPPGEAAAVLGADYWVEGTVRRDAGGVRITASLFRRRDGVRLWASRFDRPWRNALQVQRDVAERVAASLVPELLPRASAPEEPLLDVARDAYLRGRYLLHRPVQDPDEAQASAGTALGLFEQALAAEPDHAPSWVGLGRAVLGAGGDPYPDVPRARAAFERALQLAPDLAPAYRERGSLRLFLDWDFEGAGRDLRRAVELAPGESENHHVYAWWFLVSGRVDEALARVRHALELDPVSPAVMGDAGWLLLEARRYEEAAEQCRHVVTLEPTSRGARRCLMMAWQKLGRLSEARREAVAVMGLMGADEAALARVNAGQPAAGLEEWARWSLGRLEKRAEERHVHPAAFALAFAELGERERAMAALEAAADEDYCSFLPFIGVDPRLDGLRDHPRFEALERRVGLPTRARTSAAGGEAGPGGLTG